MSKKDFIALADALRNIRPVVSPGDKNPARYETWYAIVEAIADCCQRQSSTFNRARWIGYVHGENGPNGGAVR